MDANSEQPFASFGRHDRRLSERVVALHRHQPAALNDLRGRSNVLLVDLFHELADHMSVRELIECGAREAAASSRFVRAAQGRRAIALEANPHTFRTLTRLSENYGVIALNEGLAEAPGNLVLRIPREASTEGLTKGRSSFLAHKRDDRVEFVEVVCRVTTLDAIADRFGVRDSVALWIDVEGMADRVLNGGSALLDHVDLLFVETERKPLWEGQALFSDLVPMLAAHGLHPVARDCQLKNTQFNVIFVRSLCQEEAELVATFQAAVLKRSLPLNVRLRELLRFRSINSSTSVHGSPTRQPGE
jgi:FkbM family methyltransferase